MSDEKSDLMIAIELQRERDQLRTALRELVEASKTFTKIQPTEGAMWEDIIELDEAHNRALALLESAKARGGYGYVVK